jgi:hypothetical protein
LDGTISVGRVQRWKILHPEGGMTNPKGTAPDGILGQSKALLASATPYVELRAAGARIYQ